jgi:hypothetical protein
LIVAVACSDDPVGARSGPSPVIDAAVVAANPYNVLSAIVTVGVRHTDSVSVRVRLATDGAGRATETPRVAVAADVATVPVLGLLPERRYLMRVVAFGGQRAIESDDREITTGALPADLPHYAAGGSNPSPGYVVFAANRYAIAIDNTGRVVWYRLFPDGIGLNLMAQAPGRYLARPPTPQVGDAEPWVELDPLGNVTRTLGCQLGLQPRLHDIILVPDGSYWVLCDEIRTMDLRADGGVAAARVTGTTVQHVSADGVLLFSWSPFDHFAITDVDLAERTGSNVNWTHGNAIDLDADGNLLLSSRNLGEITKIDTRTGAVLWRMGGRRNEFSFIDTPMPAFSHQHGARALVAGELMLLDNMGDPNESRAERYVVNEAARIARLVRSYAAVPGAFTEIGGSVQRGDAGRTLVSFGTAGRVEEYDAEGRVVWRIEGNAGYVFRAQRILSLYAPGVGTAR